MPRGRAWTTSEIAYLKKWAGRKQVAEIHRHIKRSPHAIEHMAARLGLSLRVRAPSLEWCPECAKWRELKPGGICPVCKARRRIEHLQKREEALMAKLEPKARALKRPQLRGSHTDPKPPPLCPSQASPEWAHDVAATENARAEQRWELANLRREMAARRRRCERLEEQVEKIL